MATTSETLASLLANVEAQMDDQWGQVYLDNARLSGQSAHEFRAHLAVLSRKGLYKPAGDDCFGYVRSE